MTDEALYGDVLAARRIRGRVRIVLGALGLIATITGLVLMSSIVAFVAAVVAPLTAAPVSAHGTTIVLEARPTATHYVYVPAAEAHATRCTVEGGDGVRWEPEQVGLPATIAGTDYAQIGTLTASSAQEVTLSCEGTSDVAVTTLGLIGTVASLVLVGVLFLLLLLWGVLALVRSTRGTPR